MVQFNLKFIISEDGEGISEEMVGFQREEAISHTYITKKWDHTLDFVKFIHVGYLIQNWHNFVKRHLLYVQKV